jgi:hypothetical protein
VRAAALRGSRRRQLEMRAYAHAAKHRLRNLAGHVNTQLFAPVPFELTHTPRVLVLGVYLADKPNTAAHLVRAYAEAHSCSVEQRWIAINGIHTDPLVQSVTCERVDGFVPKFSLLNRALGALDLTRYDYVVISDDDVRVRKRCLDSLIGCQKHFGFALAQPARTWASYGDHRVVKRDPRYLARQTWFVEIGPIISVQQRALEHVLPFDEQSPMGYGYDYVWPCVLREAGLTMGVIDCCPVDHTQRERSLYYSVQSELDAMHEYLRGRPHLSYREAMRSVRGFATAQRWSEGAAARV